MDNRNACAEKRGTWAGHMRHRRADEKPCAECEQASRDYQNRRNGAKRPFCKAGCGRRGAAARGGLCAKCHSGPIERTCGYCEAPFTARLRGDGRWTETCSKSCAQRLRIKRGQHAWQQAPRYGTWTDGGDPYAAWRSDAKRRALKAGAPTEPYTREEIAERDGYVCGLCGGGVDMELRWPDPHSPSIDHIVPLSRGGTDLKTNVQLAHLRSNTAKGAGETDGAGRQDRSAYARA